MMKKGLSLVEVAVVSLILSLLLFGVVRFIGLASNRFSKQETAVLMASESAAIISRLRSDLVYAACLSDNFLSVAEIKKSIVFSNNVLSFSILGKNSFSSVKYQFIKESGQIIRSIDGRSQKIGMGMIAEFFCVVQVMVQHNGQSLILSFPFDPESSGSEEVPLEPDLKPERVWIKLILSMKSPDKSKPAQQNYRVRFFPFHLNRRMNSVWAGQKILESVRQ